MFEKLKKNFSKRRIPNARRILAALLAAIIALGSLPLPSVPVNAASKTVKLTTGEKIYYGDYNTTRMYFNKTNVGYCVEPMKRVPDEGRYEYELISSGSRLGKALYYLQGGRGYADTIKKDYLQGWSDDKCYVISHMVVAYFYQDYDDDSAFYGAPEEYCNKAIEVAAAIKKLATPPDNFKAFIVPSDDGSQTLAGSFYLDPGWVEIKKSSDNTSISKGNENYSLEGATYGIYDEDDHLVDKLVTDENGYAKSDELDIGDYYIKEIKASKGYALDTKSYNITIKENETVTKKVKETPQNSPVELLLQKLDAETEKAEAQAPGSLADAEFTVKFYTEQSSKDPAENGATPERTWIFKTDSDGKIQFTKKYFVSGDEFYYQTDETTLCFPLGTVTVQETKAPTGYVLNDKVFVQKITASGKKESVEIYNSITVPETLIRGGVKVQKSDADTMTPEAQGSATLTGTAFTITYLSESPIQVNGKTYTNGQAVLTIYSDDNGIATTESKVLPIGHYKIEETKAPTGYLLGQEKALEFDIVEHGKIVDLTSNPVLNPVIRGGVKIQKRDAETNKTEAQGNATLENAVFSIISLNENPVLVDGISYTNGQTVMNITTDKTGLAVTSTDALPYGKYRAVEITPPKGYLNEGQTSIDFSITENGTMVDLTSTEKSISNDIIRGGVKIQKRDYETKKAEPQGNATLENAVFTITSLNENPVTVNGTSYTKNQAVLVLSTDKDGFVSTADDVLPYGHYRIDETTAPEGYLNEGQISIEFDIVEHKKIVDLTSEENSIANKPIRGDLDFVKVSDGNLNRLANIPFSITSKTTGESHIIITDRNGYASTSSDWNKHTQNTNRGETPSDGIWFGTAAPDDTVGALPYDTYTIEELSCEANKDLELLKFDITVYRNNHTINLGTLTDDSTEEDVEIITTALDKETKSHLSNPDETVTIIDTVEYEGLKKGLEYRIVGTLMDKETGEAITVNDEPVTAETTFTAKRTSGKVDVVFSFDGSAMKGKTTVVFEKLYSDNLIIATHTDIDDIDQTIYFPEIGTTAKDAESENNMANADEQVTIIDTVSYKNLIVGEEYVLTGTLMDKETGKPVEINGKEITTKTTFTAPASEGSVDVTFQFDGSVLKGKTVVVFESLSYNDKELIVHADIEDEGQTIYFPELATTATDTETGDHVADADQTVTLTDTVLFQNLIPGKEYKVSGILMDKETGNNLLVNEKTVTSEITFTPETSNGSVELTFTFDGSSLAGKSVVAFESLTYEGIELAVHADIEDEGQTVHFPKIQTTAKDSDTSTNLSHADDKTVLTDTVTFKNLIAGKEYTMTGVLMDKETGEILLVNGNPVTGKTKFTPDSSNGSIEVHFTLNAASLKGKTIVVFETLLLGDEKIASHADIDDVSQTIHFPEIATSARDGKDNDNTVLAEQNTTIIDTVTYKNLTPGIEYKITGVLMDKKTGKKILVNKKPVTAEISFIPEASEGTVEVTFNFDATELGDTEIVVFEKLFISNGDISIEIASHEDINDEKQTVTIQKITKEISKETSTTKAPKTGDTTPIFLYGLISLAAFFATLGISIRKIKKRNN